ncbi:GNAT family N-acetyltransferase [uncultured Enterovirga sp.]|uniref:GNAT family N-acetyltransferase n=1 Tax=uncultured Enterovirga sp. TaxID=2026352 RepID=UPI0035C9E5E3
MSSPNCLIDTNVFIGLEDQREVSSDFAALQQLASKHGVGILIHEAARDDLARDRDSARRQISLSKIAKFQILGKVRGLTAADLAAQFGALPRPNDVVDATLLHALTIGAVDFLISEDTGLHDRARRRSVELARRVLYVADAALLLRTTYEPIDVPIRFIEEVDAHTIPANDPIFDSLREGYPGFDSWWREKCVRQRRKCWVVTDEGKLAGIVVRKVERAGETDASLPGEKILKVCTFKVRPERRGIKLGELLLKQVLWFGQKNHFDVVYLTAYPAQTTLIELVRYYGFQSTLIASDGEITFEKSLYRDSLSAEDGEDLFRLACKNYPRFHAGPRVEAYGVPIRAEFHEALFPELRDAREPELFEFGGMGQGPRLPGNTIRKVYLCRAKAWIGQPGALLFFYKSLSERPPSQAITTVGIFEDMTLAHSTDALRRLAGGRSVYSERQLQAWKASAEKPVKAINFLLIGHVEPPVTLPELRHQGIFDGHPPQSIFRFKPPKLAMLLRRLDLGFAVQ